MAAAVVLLAFLTIAVLDSIHFYPRLAAVDSANGETQYASETISVFDQLVGPLRTQVEKTYSAPFALYAFSKETIERDDGSTVRDYPRLLHRWRAPDRHAAIGLVTSFGEAGGWDCGRARAMARSRRLDRLSPRPPA